MRIWIAVFALTLLAACQTEAPPPNEPLNFSGPHYVFNVSGINIVQDYQSSKHPPHVEQLADVTPANAVKQWAGIRLTAAGHANTMEVDIKDASIVRKDLPKQKTGIEGWFTTEQTEQYNGSLAVELKIYTPDSALPVGHITVTAQQSLTLPEDSTVLDREHAYHQITAALLKDFTNQVDDNIHRYLGNFLIH